MALTPEPSFIRKEDVYALGARIASQLEYTPNGDIGLAVRKAGGRIKFQDPWDFETGDSGSMHINKLRDFVIYVSTFTSLSRDRFTIAHELGHYVLHYFIPFKNSNDKPEAMRCTRAGEGRVEWEANWFAAGFLMPQNEFKKALEEENNDYDLVAERFGVSRQAAEFRANIIEYM
ncbi:MAG: ImmA/IrrE family metallo-endopeptidase [Magnetococcales bacterium]|nr:ImmA/IrrE family metallo-endopeptidase [Magnetococcales bacterium]